MQFQIIEELNSPLSDVTSHAGKAVAAAKSWRNKVIIKVRFVTADRSIHKHSILKMYLKHSQGCFVYISMFHELSDDEANGM